MRHLAFYQALAQCPDEESEEWATDAGGLLLLRYFDWWLADGPAIAGADQQALAMLRQQLQRMPDRAFQARRLLQHALAMLVDAQSDDPSPVVGPLLAYARCLEDGQKFELAIDVLVTVIDSLTVSVSEVRDPYTAATALLRLGHIHRRMEAFDLSEAAYTRGVMLATEANDPGLSLTLQIWRAGLWRERGNLSGAETDFDRIVTEAEAIPAAHVRTLAFRGRGSVRHRRAKYDEAMRDLYIAFTLASDHPTREVILGDLAACAADSGLRELARNMQRQIADNAINPIARAYAHANLFEHAILDADEIEYTRVRQAILSNCDFGTLPKELEVYVALLSARGLATFNTRHVALAAFHDVAELAQRSKMHHYEFEARDRMAALESSDSDALPASPLLVRDVPPELADIADAVASRQLLTTSVD